MSSYPTAGRSSVRLLSAADTQLYESKKLRNKISPRTANTRQICRYAIRNIVEIYDQQRDEYRSSLSSDISYTGMLVTSSLSADVDAHLTLRFPAPFWPNHHSTQAHVCHVRQHEKSGAYLIGVEFDQPQIAFVERLLPNEYFAASA